MENIVIDKSPAIQTFAGFCRMVGWSAVTGWRARKAGWINTVNICGRPYVTAEEVARFKTRAESGEFARERVSPMLRTANAPA